MAFHLLYLDYKYAASWLDRQQENVRIKRVGQRHFFNHPGAERRDKIRARNPKRGVSEISSTL